MPTSGYEGESCTEIGSDSCREQDTVTVPVVLRSVRISVFRAWYPIELAAGEKFTERIS